MTALTFCDMNGMYSEPRSLPNQGSWFWQQAWNFTTHEFVASWLLAKGMKLVHVAHIPCTNSSTIIVRCRFPSSRQLRSFSIERVTVFVARAANWLIRRFGIHHKGSVLWSINIGINTKTEKMLVIVRVDTLLPLAV